MDPESHLLSHPLSEPLIQLLSRSLSRRSLHRLSLVELRTSLTSIRAPRALFHPGAVHLLLRTRSLHQRFRAHVLRGLRLRPPAQLWAQEQLHLSRLDTRIRQCRPAYSILTLPLPFVGDNDCQKNGSICRIGTAKQLLHYGWIKSQIVTTNRPPLVTERLGRRTLLSYAYAYTKLLCAWKRT